MDSFALAQDSDHENSPSISPNASLTNLADHSSSSIEDKHISQSVSSEQPPPAPPLEPEIIMVSSSGSVSSPAVLPSEVGSMHPFSLICPFLYSPQSHLYQSIVQKKRMMKLVLFDLSLLVENSDASVLN